MKTFSLRHNAAVLVLSFVLVLSCFGTSWRLHATASGLPQDEVDALQQVIRKLGIVYWKFNAGSCKVETIGLTMNPPPKDAKANITCDCTFQNNTCHIVAIEIKRFNLPGILPPELVKLPYIKRIDFAFNYLNGSLPIEWTSMHIEFISLVGNRLSGEIPKEFGNMSSLIYLDLESNLFSGTVPRELGKLANLTHLFLSTNLFSGNLPAELAELRNLTDFRINDNNFNGTIPDYIQNWKHLERLEIQASGLDGPIPKSISVLENLIELRISDINGSSQDFPVLTNMTELTRIVLRKCNISGKIPAHIWELPYLRVLDISFNNLVGEIPSVINAERLVFIFLSGNLLSGDIPRSILRKGTNVDLSYNNFTWQSPEQPACQQNLGLYLNLFRSSSSKNNLSGILPCMKDKDFKCPRQWHSLYVNSGGERMKIKRNEGNTWYEGDAEVDGGAAKYFLSDTTSNWGFSSTGDFMDDNDFQNTKYIANLPSSNISDIYTTARLSPLSLTYYRYCMENGSYLVSLHFAEIQFTSDNTYSSLGRRIFDIYIQGELVQKDFNIADEASGVAKPIIKQFNATVTNNILEIRFYWAGKGTTRIPTRGVYGPLISAISVDPKFIPLSEDGKKRIIPILSGVLGSFLIVMALGFVLWRRYLRRKSRREEDLKVLDLQTSYYTLKQIKAATNNFDSGNKIGEGGFGPVYKGLLSNGTVIAVKQLSSKSSQGNREFLNEIGMITCFQHPNLVKLYGCCIEGDQLLLVYEYLENNSLSRALFGTENCQLKLDWSTRHRICIGIAKGLAFLHEESRLKIIHRDIKGTNVLLDRDLNPKISDFGLAKLYEEEKTHVSTRIAGTIGYMAPEYALWGYLTYKADVYSFGILALEIVSGKHNMSYESENDCACLLDWACHLQQNIKLLDLVDQKLGSEFNKVEAERMIKVALLCTNATPSLRPTMSEVASMLEGTTEVPNVIPEGNGYNQDLRFKAIRDHRRQILGQSSGGSSVHRCASVKPSNGSFSGSTNDLYDINMDSYLRVKAIRNQDISQTSEGSQTQVSSSATSYLRSSLSSGDRPYDITLETQ